jgi:hypothetical protein
MSMRLGNRGQPMWPDCINLGVAAITYYPLSETDLTNYPYGEPKELWAQLEPSQKASLRRLTYEMKKGDVIYIKDGPKIIGRGIVGGDTKRAYQFDSKHRIRDLNGKSWPHQVPVEWENDFTPINVRFGAEPLTVKELNAEDLKQLNGLIEATNEKNAQVEAIEGDIYNIELQFRKRNSALIHAKKVNSNYRCEVCDFSFEEKYGDIGKEYIVAHHVNPIAVGLRKTTLNDIALLCQNCHAMAHTRKEPISIKDLRELVKSRHK